MLDKLYGVTSGILDYYTEKKQLRPAGNLLGGVFNNRAVRTYISHAEFAESRKDYAGHNLDKIDYTETYFASLVCSIRTAFLLNSLPSA